MHLRHAHLNMYTYLHFFVGHLLSPRTILHSWKCLGPGRMHVPFHCAYACKRDIAFYRTVSSDGPLSLIVHDS